MSNAARHHLTSPSDGWPRPAYAWYVVFVLTVAYTFSFVDRQILSLLVGPIRRDLGLSDTQIGLLQGLAFAVFYSLLGIPIARLADHHSRRGIIAAGVGAWSLMTVACGFARSYPALFAARMGVGVGEAALSPPAFSLLADYFPPHRLSAALGVYAMGIYIGAGLAYILGGAVISFASGIDNIILPLIGPVFTWQMVFFLVGLPGLLVALLLWTVKEPARRGLAGEDSVKKVSFSAAVDFIFRRWRTFFPHFFGLSLLSMTGYGGAAWTPEFLIRVHGYGRIEVAYYYGLMVLVLAPVGVAGAGWLAGRMSARGITDATMRIIAVAAVLLVPVGVAAPLQSSLPAMIGLAVPMIVLQAVPFGIGPAALQVITPNRMRAQVSAVYILVINLIGLGLGPFFVAALSQYVFADGMTLGWSLSILHGLAPTAAAVIVFSGLRHYRQSYAGAASWRPRESARD